ncbi:hypothetical protein [Enterobacter sp. V87_3]|uniref:hypothetical protein n=1 Tax=Enterobacter sp. V87_3 TaxID=3044236 RepID=UPI00249EA094|nr:hypothetical protein [Enterobacter sp. V87_3]MDI3424631.1 hypothetical protein [Enterobacter sp. V87_3]
MKTYYIHPAAFGSTQDPGHGHVPVVKADDLEKLRAKLEAAEKRIAELEAKLETADKLQDSAFRHGLQRGFSFGQTDNQAGFEECLSAYSTRGKDNG